MRIVKSGITKLPSDLKIVLIFGSLTSPCILILNKNHGNEDAKIDMTNKESKKKEMVKFVLSLLQSILGVKSSCIFKDSQQLYS